MVPNKYLRKNAQLKQSKKAEAGQITQDQQFLHSTKK